MRGSHDADIPVAIIGMAARAAGAPGLDVLWRLIESGHDVITDIPPDRLPGFDAERLGAKAPRAALLDRIDTFDAGFFGLSPRQAAYTDPRQRILLEETWHALEDACVPPSSLAGTATGVFVGSTGADFRLRCDGLGAIDQYTASGTMDAFLANRISYHFDTQGASVEVDTACSSGLTAVVQATWALSAGQVDLAIAAGVSVICHGFDQEAYFRAGILSPSGQVRPFSEEADGYVRGEGAAVVILKRLEDAQRDGDPVRAVIRGACQSHDGRSGGQFGPSPQTQAALIRRTADRAGISPAELGYVEAHATGTKLGDQAEATGLIQALDGADRAAGPGDRLWVGALKAIIGHTEGAAGLFGLIKAVLVLEHDHIPAIPRFAGPRAGIGVNGSVLGFPAAPVTWPRTPGRARLAGISSFGLGGANAHVVISDPPPVSAEVRGGPGARVFPLSAATQGALAKLAAAFGDCLRDYPDADLPSIAWTLQTGRSALPCRAVLYGDDVATVAAAAASLTPVAAADPVAAAFLAGQDADWTVLWEGGAGARRTRLPGYPFERDSHWPRAERAPEELPPRPVPPRAAPHCPAPPQSAPPPGAVPASGALVRLPSPDAYGPAAVVGEPTVTHAPPKPLHVPERLRDPQPHADPGSLAETIAAIAAEVLYLEPGEVTPDQDLAAAGLDSVLAVEFTQLVRTRIGLELRTERIYAARTSRALAAELAGAPAEAPPAVPAEAPPLAEAPAVAELTERLRRLASDCLYLPEEDVDIDAELTSIGLDSVLAVEFLAKLNSACGTTLSLTDMYGQRTLNGLAAALGAMGRTRNDMG